MKNTTHAFKNTFSYKLIYVFAIADDAHSDCLKIGDKVKSILFKPKRGNDKKLVKFYCNFKKNLL